MRENLRQDARKFLSRGKKICIKTQKNFCQEEKKFSSRRKKISVKWEKNSLAAQNPHHLQKIV
jgi:hypothetical protein